MPNTEDQGKILLPLLKKKTHLQASSRWPFRKKTKAQKIRNLQVCNQIVAMMDILSRIVHIVRIKIQGIEIKLCLDTKRDKVRMDLFKTII